VVSTDASGQEGWDEAPVLVPTGNITGTLTITTDLSGQTFNGGEPISDMDWTGSVNFGTITPVVVLDSDGAGISGLNIGGHGMFFQNFPFVSTDRARLALQVRNNSNDAKWFFCQRLFFHPSRRAPGTSTTNRRSQVARRRRIISRGLDCSCLLDSHSVTRSAVVRHSGIV
jgi:hypothetical protein